jgi:hypothetical protein
MSEAHPNRRIVPLDDAQRITRLSEEIRSRLFEIALIATRSTPTARLKGHVLKFVPREAARQANAGSDAGAGDWVEIIEVDGFEVCYGVIDGHPFAESPCGAGG